MTQINLKISALLLAALVISSLQPGRSFGAGPDAGAPGSASPAGVTADAAAPGSAKEVLARVNGAPITRAEVDRAIVIFLAQSRLSHDLSPESRKEAENAALEQLIGAKLLCQHGVKLEISDLERQVAEKMAQAKGKFPTPAAYDAALSTNNLTEAEAREIVRNDIVVTNLLDKEVIAKIVISDSDIRDFYQQNRDKFSRPESVQLSHILVAAGPGAAAPEKLQARAKAGALRGKLLAGANFAALARAESSCPSKEEGGDLGVFGKDELIPEFEKPVAGLKVGEFSQVVETSFGFHVLKLVAREGATASTLDEAKEKIAYYLQQARTQQAIVDYVSGLKKQATIVVL